MTVKLPALFQPFVDKKGLVIPPWNFFLQALTAAPAAIVGIGATGSPQSFMAPDDGQLAITGGMVSGVQIQRGTTTLSVGTPSIIGLSQNDIAVITYSVAPTLSFIPS